MTPVWSSTPATTRATPPIPIAAGGPARWHGGLLYAIAAVWVLSAVFCYRQNIGHQLGGTETSTSSSPTSFARSPSTGIP